jgi:DUF2974 family protein
MKKFSLLIIFLIANQSYADFTFKQAAQMSAATYEENDSNIGNYRLYDKKTYRQDLKLITYANHKTKEFIIAFRGTDPTKLHNILVDVAIFQENTTDSATMAAIHSLKHWQNWFKETLATHANGAVKVMAPELSDLVVDTARDSMVAAFGDMAIDGTQKIVDMRKLLDDAAQKALSYFDKIQRKLPGYQGCVTGHSKGGYYAQIVAATYGVDGYSLNAPGAQSYIKKMNQTLKPSKFINYIRRHDVVGKLGEHFGEKKIIDDLPFERALNESELQTDSSNLYDKTKQYISNIFNVMDRKKYMWRYLMMNHSIAYFL